MTQTVELPLWLFILIVVFAAVTFASHFLFPSVRWFFRRRLERAVSRLNTRLQRPIQPFKLARRHDTIQRVIYDPEVSHAVQDHARATGTPEAVVFEQARRFAGEIVPSFSAFTYFSFATRAARLIGNALYDVRLAYADEAGFRAIDPDATVVYVMNHRSNMDYVLVTYLSAEQSALSYAVGEWARVWPLSRLIRALGAYFIRRRSGSELYRAVLATYVRQATEAGVTQAIFPEGGLSLTGALMQPKLGLLKYIVDGSGEREVVFVPVALNYDRVLEDSVLTDAASRRERRFRARIGVITWWFVKQVWRKSVGRYQRFGTAAVNFGRPVSLSDFRNSPGDPSIPLARDLMKRIVEVLPIVTAPLVCWLLREEGAMSESQIADRIRKLLVSARDPDLHLSADAMITSLPDTMSELNKRGVVVRAGDLYAPSEARRALLDYYAASVAPAIEPFRHAAVAKQISAPAGS
ncbi:1-acyl-sn-glycerol-3-phosphate acyltransferase [Lutimaribacter marinistellae]|uniref:Glycerol-3-phosphate acyltransferase n=1 Tax=Lutimaribacter marinistellae TaxID=1820329 RepID=A0ABV7TAX6_9RHOB